MTGEAPSVPRSHRRWRWLAVLSLILVVASGVGATAWVVSLGPVPLAEAREVSRVVVDRNGKLLRAYAMDDGRWRLPVDARQDVDPRYIDLLLAY